MKNIITSFFLCLFFVSAFGQITISPVGINGNHQFTSTFPSDHMHFYLFGDGYHSFVQNPSHQYHDSALSSVAEAYVAGPYDDDDIDPALIGSPTTGATVLDDLGPETMDNMVQVKRSWNLVTGNENFFILMIENKNDRTPWNGCVEFHFNVNDSQINNGEIQDEHNGWFGTRTTQTSNYASQGYTHKFVWPYSNLVEGEQRYIYIPTNCLPDPFATVKTCGVLKNQKCSQNVPYTGTQVEGKEGSSGGTTGNTNNGQPASAYGTEPFYELLSMVSSFPHDPNMIIPSDCNYLGQNYGDVTIPYRIYFQNEGTGPVQHVRVEYFTYNDFFNIKLVATSHDVGMTWYRNGGPAVPFAPSQVGGGPISANGGITSTLDPLEHAATFNFNYIYLPGTNQFPPPEEYEETIGWVDFEVCYNLQHLPNLAGLGNLIDIYFDYLEPVSDDHTLYREDAMHEPRLCDDPNCPEMQPPTQTVHPFELDFRSSSSNIEPLDLRIYPNPVSEILTLEILSEPGNKVSATILDVNNQVALYKNIGSGNQTLDVCDLPAGVYYIKVTNNKEFTVKSFVKI